MRNVKNTTEEENLKLPTEKPTCHSPNLDVSLLVRPTTCHGYKIRISNGVVMSSLICLVPLLTPLVG